jgi:hypothetical protein
MRAVLFVIALSTGCNHYRTPIPGVLDLRSDGTGAPVAETPLAPEAERNGLDSLMKGDGTKGKVEVEIHDRGVWALRLMFLGDGASQEVSHAFRGRTALRNLTIAEEIGVGDTAMFFCTMPVPCVPLVLGPTFSFRAFATRIGLDDLTPSTDEAPRAAPPTSAPPPPTGPVKEPTVTPPVDRPAQ